MPSNKPLKLSEKILRIHERNILDSTTQCVTAIAKLICDNYRYIKMCQPHITGIHTAMGTWSFNGYGVGICTEEGHEGEAKMVNDIDIADIIKDGSPDWYDFNVNEGTLEVCDLLDTLVDDDKLNCSTWQDGFDERGVLFEHSETENQNNPFSTPNKKYTKSLPYYKALVEAGVPVHFVNISKALKNAI